MARSLLTVFALVLAVVAFMLLAAPSSALSNQEAQDVELDPRMDCVMCQTGVFLLQELANAGFTPAQVVQNLETYFCNSNDTQKQIRCKTMIENYVPMMINLIVKYNTTIDEMCQMFHLCPHSQFDFFDNKHLPQEKDPQPDFVKCALCQTALFFTHDLVRNNYTKQEIIDTFSKVCDLFPADVQKTCIDFTKLYVPLIILNPNFNPCPTLGWCPKPPKK